MQPNLFKYFHKDKYKAKILGYKKNDDGTDDNTKAYVDNTDESCFIYTHEEFYSMVRYTAYIIYADLKKNYEKLLPIQIPYPLNFYKMEINIISIGIRITLKGDHGQKSTQKKIKMVKMWKKKKHANIPSNRSIYGFLLTFINIWVMGFTLVFITIMVMMDGGKSIFFKVIYIHKVMRIKVIIIM